MSNGLPWYKCNPADFNHGMMGLTLEERGAYVTVLNLIYQRGEPIQDEALCISTWLGCTGRTWLRIRAQLITKGKLFAIDVNGLPCLMNRRAAEEIAARAELSKERASAGSRGGRSKAANTSKNNAPEQAIARQEPDKPLAIKIEREEVEDTPSEAIASSVPLKKSRLKSKRMPENFVPTQGDLDVGAQEGLTPGEIEREMAKMRDHQFRDAHSDWGAVVRNWLRRAAELKRRNVIPLDSHERPHKLAAKEANLSRGFAGAEIAARLRAER